MLNALFPGVKFPSVTINVPAPGGAAVRPGLAGQWTWATPQQMLVSWSKGGATTSVYVKVHGQVSLKLGKTCSTEIFSVWYENLG